MDKICAYCGRLGLTKEDAYSTKEHIVPDFMIQDEKDKMESVFFERKLSFKNAPVINDVCNYCNNGVLSELDAYIKNNLYDTFFDNITYDSKILKYDFNLLSRWLLKVSYNDMRIAQKDKAFDVYSLDIIEYILGIKNELHQFRLFANLIPSKNAKRKRRKDEEYIPKPFGMRVSDIESTDGLHPKFSRMISLFNFYFYMFYPAKTELEFVNKRFYVELNNHDKAKIVASDKTFIESLEPTFNRHQDMVNIMRDEMNK